MTTGVDAPNGYNWDDGGEVERLWKPVFDWWVQNRGPVIEAMRAQVQHLKQPDVRDHVWRNFMTRVGMADKISEFGPGNFDLAGGYRQMYPYVRGQTMNEAERKHWDAVARGETWSAWDPESYPWQRKR